MFIVRPMHNKVLNPDSRSKFRFTIFQTEDGDWKIDGVAMRPLTECIQPIFHWRWRGRLQLSMRPNFTFLQALRFDYITDFAAVLIMFNFWILSSTIS